MHNMNKFDNQLLQDYTNVIIDSELGNPWYDLRTKLSEIGIDIVSYLSSVTFYRLGWALKNNLLNDSYYLKSNTVEKFLNRELAEFNNLSQIIEDYHKKNHPYGATEEDIDWESKPNYGAKEIKKCIENTAISFDCSILKKKRNYFLIEKPDSLRLLIGVDGVSRYKGIPTQLNISMVRGNPDLIIDGVNSECVFIDLTTVLPFERPLTDFHLNSFLDISDLEKKLATIFKYVIPALASFKWVSDFYR